MIVCYCTGYNVDLEYGGLTQAQQLSLLQTVAKSAVVVKMQCTCGYRSWYLYISVDCTLLCQKYYNIYIYALYYILFAICYIV